MAEFKVGDRVVIVTHYGAPAGARARVVVLGNKFLGLDIFGFEDGHNLNGRLLKSCSGFWVPQRCVKRLNEFKGNV